MGAYGRELASSEQEIRQRQQTVIQSLVDRCNDFAAKHKEVTVLARISRRQEPGQAYYQKNSLLYKCCLAAEDKEQYYIYNEYSCYSTSGEGDSKSMVFSIKTTEIIDCIINDINLNDRWSVSHRDLENEINMLFCVNLHRGYGSEKVSGGTKATIEGRHVNPEIVQELLHKLW